MGNERTELLYLEDMATAMQHVLEYTAGYDFVKFEDDLKTRHAVLMNLQIAGEAANKLSAELKARYPQIPWREMADFRIVVAHIYFSVNAQLVWDIITHHLPTNLSELQQILKEEEAREKNS